MCMRLASLQELGDVVAQCLQRQPHERPSAAHLLKHKFFKLTVKDPQGLVRNLWANVPENVQALLPVLPLPLGVSS